MKEIDERMRSGNNKWKLLVRGRWFVAGGLLVLVLLLLSVRQWPADDGDLRSSVVMVTGRVQFSLCSDSDTLVVARRSVSQQGVWVERHWWWPSQGGRVITSRVGSGLVRQAENDSLGNGDWAAWLKTMTEKLQADIERREAAQKELHYYLSCHGVQDEGYTRIAEFAHQNDTLTDSLRNVKKLYEAFGAPKNVRLMSRYELSLMWWDEEGTLQTAACDPISVAAVDQPRTMLVRTVLGKKPDGIYSVRHQLWGDEPDEVFTTTIIPSDSTLAHRVAVAQGRVTTEGKVALPSLFLPEGSAVFSKKGKFEGIVSQGKIIK